MKSHSRTKESYFLLLRTSNHFERFSADFLCIGWIEPPSMRQIFEVLCICFFSEIAAWCWNLIATSQRFDLSMWTFFLVLKSDEFQLLFQMMHDFRVLHSHLYVFFAEDGSCLGSDGLWTVLSREGNSLFKSRQPSSNHVSRSNHQLNSKLCTVFSRFFGVMFLQSFWSGMVYVFVVRL